MFTPQQKVELLKASISRIICDNSEVRDVPLDAFRFSTFPSGYVSCDHVPAIDLGAWREGKSHGELTSTFSTFTSSLSPFSG